MKKILTIAIFLLILLPMIDDASFIFAQNLTYENGSYWLPEIEVNGTNKKKCDCCGIEFEDTEEFNRHITYDYVCKSYYNNDDDNDDEPIDGKCCLCGKSIEECTCQGPYCEGTAPSPFVGTSGNGYVDINIKGVNVNDNNNNNDNTKDSLKVGDYYKFFQPCQKIFTDKLMIPPLQPESTTCVSTNLAYTQLWLYNKPIEEFDTIKKSIEDNFLKQYNHSLSENGIPDSTLQEFIQYYSGVNAFKVSLSQLKEKMKEGSPGLGTLVIRKADGALQGHEITIVGYDECTNDFICKDSQYMELKYYTEDELATYNKMYNEERNSIFYITKEVIISNY